LFASEVRGIEAAGLRQLSVNPDGVHSMLTYGSVIGPSTIFHDVKELVPGHALVVSGGGRTVRDREYWSIFQDGFAPPAQPPSIADAVANVRQALTESVKSHLVSDVPIGMFLSGGIDSSILAL